MAKTNGFQLNIRTPHNVILETTVRSARVLTETGHVGIRPRTEPTVLAVEPGIVHARVVAEGQVADGTEHEIYIGTAGGLLMCEHNTVTLLTPLAIAGDDETSIVAQIDDLMQRPNSEWEARSTFTKLEGHILSELRRERIDGIAQRLE